MTNDKVVVGPMKVSAGLGSVYIVSEDRHVHIASLAGMGMSHEGKLAYAEVMAAGPRLREALDKLLGAVYANEMDGDQIPENIKDEALSVLMDTAPDEEEITKE